MTPSEKCKSYGLESLRELSDISGVSTRTLNNWFNSEKIDAFNCLLVGAVEIKGSNGDELQKDKH